MQYGEITQFIFARSKWLSCVCSKEAFRDFFVKTSYLEEKDTSSEFEFMEHYLGNVVYFQMLIISFF